MVHLWRELSKLFEYVQEVPSSYYLQLIFFPVRSVFDFSLLVAGHVSTFRRVGDRIMQCVGCWSETTALCSLVSPATMAVSDLITFSDCRTASAMVGNKAPFCTFSPNPPTITSFLFPSVTQHSTCHGVPFATHSQELPSQNYVSVFLLRINRFVAAPFTLSRSLHASHE
jgi:hypothetical protein